jgi:hypothetical protein
MATHEMITYSYHVADAGKAIETVRDGALWPQGKGQRLGAWQVMTGLLNRVMLLTEKGEEPLAAHGQPGLFTSRHSETLRAVKPYSPQGDSAQVYEYRMYTFYPGHIDDFERHWLAIRPVRERHSPNVGFWRVGSGNLDRVIHIWAYTDLVQRDMVRPAIEAEPAWQDFAATVMPMIAEMNVTLLKPLWMPAP